MVSGRGSVANFLSHIRSGMIPPIITLQRHAVIDNSAFHLNSASRSATTDEEAEDVTSLSDRT
jgi:hypothetical protein